MVWSPLSRASSWSKSSLKSCLVPGCAPRPPVDDHVGYDDKSQNPHQHECHGDGDDGRHSSVVALVRTEHPAQTSSDSVWGPANVHHSGWGDALLHGVQASTCDLTLLALFGQGEDGGPCWDGGRRVLQEEFALAALESDGQGPLHVWWEFLDDFLVVAQTGEVLAVGELRELSTDRAGEGLELRGGDIDASQALQAESVPTRQQLWRLEDIIVLAETHSALSVLHLILRGPRRPQVTLSFPVSPPGLLTPPSLPPLSMVALSLPPPASFHPL